MPVNVNPMYTVGLRDEHVRAARRLVFTFECELPTYTGDDSLVLFHDVLQGLGNAAYEAAMKAGALRQPVGAQVRLLDAQGRDLL